MPKPPGARRSFRFPWRSREELDRDVDDELQFHIDMRAEELEAEGLGPDAARAQAQRELGNVAATGVELLHGAQREERVQQRLRFFDELHQDLRSGWRVLRLNPGFAAIAILVLALGIGCVTTIFTVVNAMLLQPIPGLGGDLLYAVYCHTSNRADEYRSFSYPEFVEIAEATTSFSALAAHDIAMVGVRRLEQTDRRIAQIVSSDFFDLFGTPIVRGRGFRPAEEAPGAEVGVAVLTHNTWKRWGEPESVVGTRIGVNGRTVEIVGVTAPDFSGVTPTFTPDLFLPLGMHDVVSNNFLGRRTTKRLGQRDWRTLLLLGRLRPGVSEEQATTELATIAANQMEAFPEGELQIDYRLQEVPRMVIADEPADESAISAGAAMILGMAAIVLLVACLNLANMMLARGAMRRTEFAVRQSLGGGRGRLVRQLLTEGALLAFCGAAAGLILASWVGRLFARSVNSLMPMGGIVLSVHPDQRVLAATVLCAVLATIAFALLPAMRLTRPELIEDLRPAGVRRQKKGRWRWSMSDAMVVGQLAFALALVFAGGLFLRGALTASDSDPGFSLERAVVAEIDVSLIGHDEARGRAMYREVIERFRSRPEIESADLASNIPFGNVTISTQVQPHQAAEDEWQRAVIYAVGPRYFDTLGMPLLRGRSFRDAAGAGVAAEAIVSEPLARRLYGDLEVLGRTIHRRRSDDEESGKDTYEIVGVVPGLRHSFFDHDPVEMLFLPFDENYQGNVHVHLKLRPGAGADEQEILGSLRQELLAIDPEMPILSLRSLRSHRDAALSLWTLRAVARVLLVFAGVALALAAIGIYGVRSFLVERRRREIGIRMALGADRRDVVRMLLREGAGLGIAGVGLGVLLSLAIGRALSSMLYRVSSWDPLVLLAGVTTLAGMVLLATYLPARRASRLPPADVLRQE